MTHEIQKIALLGNSHAASIKQAYDDHDTDTLPLDITFFARPNGRGGLKGLEIVGSRLVPKDEALRRWFERTSSHSFIDLDSYDAFWVYGFGPESRSIFNAAEHASSNSYSTSLMRTCIERYQETMADMFRKSPLYVLASLLRDNTSKDIFVSGKPIFSENHLISTKKTINPSVFSVLLDAHISAIRNLLQEIDCRIIFQPPNTLSQACFTKQEFAMKDNTHMNAAFGEIMLGELTTTESVQYRS